MREIQKRKGGNKMPDLHRHSEYSLFDGFGKAPELAKLAKEKGYTAIGISDHGNTNGLVQHYKACMAEGIKPILGVEAYFQPVKAKEKPRYHLCLFAKNLKGYKNINRIQFIGEKQKYYNAIVTLKELRKYNEGIICTSACIGGYISKAITEGKMKMADKMIKEYKNIFGDDFYIEIQPYTLSEPNLQEEVNVKLMKLARRNKVKCILTSDSHYGSKEDLDTYMKMHQIAKHDKMDIKATYGERYMPTYEELTDRFVKMHAKDLGNSEIDGFDHANQLAEEMIDNLREIEEKVENDILGQLPLMLPEYIEGEDSFNVLIKKVKKGLKIRGKYTKEYINRCKEELEVIKHHGFAEYFLIVADYVNWAKDNGIVIGPGRGSVCNSQVAYALRITEVDSLKFGLDFRRFLRKDKTKLPDVDLDFQTNRRQEVIEYLTTKYKGHASQICSYGLYKVDNLINDLVKVCELEDKEEIKKLKKFVNKYVVDGRLEKEDLLNSQQARMYNTLYDNIIIHFAKLFKKVRFIGTHAAGVAITGGNILDYTSLKVSKDGKLYTNYDLGDLESINVIKFDILGLKTMESLSDLRKETGTKEFDEKYIEDEKIIKQFGEGETDGIFQFEKRTARDILKGIHTDCFDDVVAASAMNRPGPLSLNMPQQYAENKLNINEVARSKRYYDYTKETYGTIVYQEQLQQICVNIGGMSWADSDKVMKILKGSNLNEEYLRRVERDKKELTKKFVKGAVKNGLTKMEAKDLFEQLLVYSFNKGHAVGYTLISVEEMYYKVYHPTEYWYSKIKHAGNDGDLFKFILMAIKNGVVVFLPHVNYSALTTMRTVDGEKVIQQGLYKIKGVGEKAAKYIVDERNENGNFTSYEDFEARCRSRAVHKGVLSKLLDSGALEFDKRTYINRVVKYNSAMLARV
jgi:DNA polymerase-3 subunit alpha